MNFGPPYPGAPWASPEKQFVGTPKAQPAPTPYIAWTRLAWGPPMRGAPWLPRPPLQPLGRKVPQQGKAIKLPLVERVPFPLNEDRLRRFTEKVMTILNSLIRKGQLKQIGQDEWEIVP